MLECLEMQIDAMSSVNALNVAIFRSPAGFGSGFIFLLVTFCIRLVPDVWRLWAGPRLP